MSGKIGAAFVLGAGLGTRLRPLTEARPKPLVPIVHKPLITFAFDHLHAFGIRRFVVNTHHCPAAYDTLLGAKNGKAEYRRCQVILRHEPELLDTGGGIANVRESMGNSPFLVHNGDVLADLPLDRLIERHFADSNVATLGLRSSGGPLQVQCDVPTGRVTDIRGGRGNRMEPAFLFTGIYLLSPEIFRHMPADRIFSIVPVFLDLLRSGAKVGGVVMDEGLWFDLGTRASYLEAHRMFLAGKHSLSYPLDRPWPLPIHPSAKIAPNARLNDLCAVGPDAEIASGAHLTNCIVWENAKIASRTILKDCIVRDGRRAEGTHSNADL